MTFKSTTNALISSAMLALPMSGCYHRNTMPAPTVQTNAIATLPADTFVVTQKQESPLVKGLPRYFYPNTRGLRIEEFDENNALWKLAERVYDTTGNSQKYTAPIDTAHKPFIASGDIFGAPRGLLPNFGIDISIPNDSTNKPIAVLAPTKGILIMQQKPLRKQGIQANKIMGTDGLIYSFRFPTKAKDYIDAKLPYFQKIGTEVKEGDTLGLISPSKGQKTSTLHMEVEDLMEKDLQEHHATWRGLRDMLKIKIQGQINPLDSNASGDIAKVLHQYKIEKGSTSPLMKQLEILR